MTKKLIVDDGRYEESEWARQLAVTADDRYLLATDSKHGVRIYDLTNGRVINAAEGHSLDGDAYYDAQAAIFVTTGDRTIKVWDVRKQKLIKRIRQGFHSQFMENVYIDSKKQFVFAQGVKYSFTTGKTVMVYEKTGMEMQAPRYFFQDRYYLLDESKGKIRVYDCFTDNLVATYTLGDYSKGTDKYFDNNSGRLFIGYTNGVRILDIVTGQTDFAKFDRKGAFSNLGQTSSYAVSADGNFLVAGSNQGVGLVVVRKKVPGGGFAGNTLEVMRQNFNIGEIHALHASNKVVYTANGAIHLLDLDAMELLWSSERKTVGVRNIHLAPDGTHLYIDFGSQGKVNRHWFERTFTYSFDTYFDSLDAHWGTFKVDLRETDVPHDLLDIWRERFQAARLKLKGDISVEAAPAHLPFPSTGTSASPYDPVTGVVVSPTGRYSLESKDFGRSILYDRDRPIGQAPDLGVIYHVEYAPDERYVALGGSSRWVAVLDLLTGKVVQKVYAESYVTSITFSYDHLYMFTGSLKNEILMWRLSDGNLVRKFIGSNGGIVDTEIDPDGMRLLSIAEDGALRFWDVSTGAMLMAVFFMHPPVGGEEVDRIRRNPWVVVTPDGRFDTNDLAEIKGLHWIVPDDPLRVLPLEIFMRDYYEPRLLPRVLAGEHFSDLPRLDQLNRAQPTIQIRDVQVDDQQAGLVAVTVEVANDTVEMTRADKPVVMQSGAFDLRLFRDGQLVAQFPERTPAVSPGEQTREQELAQWRQRHQIPLDPETLKKTVTFHGIRLPRRAGVREVRFSAYAFNEDRVKSETTRMSFAIPAKLSPLVPRAYLVSVGVNAFEDSRWDLSYAANDAKQLGTVLKGRLEAQRDEQGQPRYEKVVWVGLTAEAQEADGQRRLTKVQANKAQIEAVLKTLAGQPVNAEAVKGIDHAQELRRANPEDLVIIALSTHGEVDKRGLFYLLPHDIGSNATEQQRRARAISNDDLSEWLRGLDAIDLVMIVDACHSAASVQTQEFKPGPMGSRGLGQLAYDKGMRILAATQIDQYALETQKTQQGLLSYALVHEGLKQNKADYKPKDQQIWLSEWLSYASERVPGLYQDWREGNLKGTKKGELLDAPEEHPGDSPSLQQPALFDFARNRDALIGSGVR